MGVQVRPKARALTAEQATQAESLYGSTAAGNAVVVHDLLTGDSA